MHIKIAGLLIGSLVSWHSTWVEAATAIAQIPYALAQDNTHASDKLENNRISLTAAPGTDLFISPDSLVAASNTPKISFAPKGDFTFSAKVSGQFLHNYDGGALFVWVDARNWAKLLFEKLDTGPNGIATLVTQGASDDAHHGEFKGGSIYLKITRKGSVFSFYGSRDGRQWLFMRKFRLEVSQPLSLGFTAQAPLSDVPVTAVFTDIHFEQ